MEFLLSYGLFLAKIVTFVIAVVAVLVIAKSLSGNKSKGELQITNLNDKYKEFVGMMESHLYDENMLKVKDKAEKKAEKAKHKQQKTDAKKCAEDGKKPTLSREAHVFVVDFKGSIDAREVTSLREEITAILAIAQAGDEVLVRLESGGGMVHAYGLASSQLDRIKQAGITLTIAVDKVAASGGYMMACVAEKIIAAPFAIIGSIGVIAQLPNFNKLLRKHDIEFEQLTAGEFKRTLTMFGENTEKGREKFLEELEETHTLFKAFIADHRPNLALEEVSTGEHWYGKQALEFGLIDQIGTSDDYLISAVKEKKVLAVHYVQRKKISEKFAQAASTTVEHLALKWASQGNKPIV